MKGKSKRGKYSAAEYPFGKACGTYGGDAVARDSKRQETGAEPYRRLTTTRRSGR